MTRYTVIYQEKQKLLSCEIGCPGSPLRENKREKIFKNTWILLECNKKPLEHESDDVVIVDELGSQSFRKEIGETEYRLQH